MTPGASAGTRFACLPLPDTGIDGLALPRARRVVSHEGRDGRLPRVYAARFDLLVRTGLKVDALSSGRSIRRCIRQPPFRSGTRGRRDGLPPSPEGSTPSPTSSIRASCSSIRASTNASQLQEGAVLVVGAGNSGAEIAFEVSRTRIPHSSLASPRESSPSVTDPLWRDSSSP